MATERDYHDGEARPASTVEFPLPQDPLRVGRWRGMQRAGRYDLGGKGGRLNAAKQSRAKTRMKLGAPRRRASARWVGEVCCEICAMNAMLPPPPRASKLITRACGN